MPRFEYQRFLSISRRYGMSFSTLGNFGRNAGIPAVEFSIRDQIFARYTTPDSASAFLKRAGSASIKRHPEQSALENPSRQRPGTASLLNVSRTYGCRRPIIVAAALDCLLREFL
jgi:hypothetical protein